MIANFILDSKTYRYNTDHFYDLSIPIDFTGKQANFFDVERAVSKPYQKGNVIGDTQRGGGCNFDVLTLIPHCNGTHTECVGHIVNEDVFVSQLSIPALIPATLKTVEVQNGVITDKLISVDSVFNQALIIRTLPNSDDKKTAVYSAGNLPAYFSEPAMIKINQLQIKHLLVDLPSIDRAYDEGKLKNHHTFWNVEQGSHSLKGKTQSQKTITELIYIPDEIPDGKYLLQIQWVPFLSDAVPSRPIIFPVEEQ